ncbi:APC family permease [uncultured Leifsonia sp.]|uniref:APC family permease n=1 Tax=uncultured Leifsonia sp. TaxID=340359 RepID=UPI0025D5A71D|nr:APC family permease [uncultured Leifsonia sp.]
MTSSNRNRSGYGRGIGLLGATAIGIGGMVGGGIFAVLGVASVQAGPSTPVAFAVAGLVAAVTAVSYARLSVRFRSAGGTVTFIDRVFGIGTVTGSLNIVLWLGYIVTTALYASAFGSYSATLLPGGTHPDPLLLRALIGLGIAVPWIINLANAGLIARSESIIVGIKLSILVVVIVAGIPAVSPAHFHSATSPSTFSTLGAGMLIFVAYEGFELIANAGADARRLRVTLPWAFALSVGLVIVLYVVIAVVVIGSLSPAQISASADFALARAAQSSLGGFGFVLVAVAAVLATLSAINATLYGTARLSFTIATEGELPRRLEARTWNQPIGLHITALAGLVLAVALPVESISAVASAIFLAIFAVVNAAACKEARQVLWIRLIGAAGAIGCVASLVIVVVHSVGDDPTSMIVLAGLLAVALIIEHGYLKRHRPHPIDTRGSHKGGKTATGRSVP